MNDELAVQVDKECLTCKDLGRNCNKCLKGLYNNKTLLVPDSFESAESKKHKAARFSVRAFNGVACGYAKKYRFRWFVLTESNEALEAGLKFGKVFHNFIKWLRYSCPDFQYIVIVHRQGDMLRQNYHVLSYGSDKLPLVDMKAWWLENYMSTVTGMEEIVDIRKAVYYLSGYLGKKEKFVKSFCSQGWVYPGWLGDSRKYNKEHRVYIRGDVLVKLALISDKKDREYELDYLMETGLTSEEFNKIKENWKEE